MEFTTILPKALNVKKIVDKFNNIVSNNFMCILVNFLSGIFPPSNNRS